LLIFCLPEAHRNQRHDCLFDGGLNSVNLLRLPAAAIVLAAAVLSFPQDGAAENLNNVSITIEPDWEGGGYMGLGGGLVRSIAKGADDKPTISEHRPRRVRATRASRAVAAINNVAPLAFVAETLDHTGFNISSMGAHVGAR
jgi:hypothetical protein